jgi:hypothetical protein
MRRNNAAKTYTDARGKFRPGNPGRPKGARHETTLAVEAILDGEAEAPPVDLGRGAIPGALPTRRLFTTLAVLQLRFDDVDLPLFVAELVRLPGLEGDHPSAAEMTHRSSVPPPTGGCSGAPRVGEVQPSVALRLAEVLFTARFRRSVAQLPVEPHWYPGTTERNSRGSRLPLLTRRSGFCPDQARGRCPATEEQPEVPYPPGPGTSTSCVRSRL